MEYTAEIFKKDGRVKVTKHNPNGEREVAKIDFEGVNYKALEEALANDWPADKGFRFEIFETFVEKRNAISGKTFVERYDTPYYLSPSSETYWCS